MSAVCEAESIVRPSPRSDFRGARAPRVAFVGRRGLGGVQMRARDAAIAAGVSFVSEDELEPSQPWDVLILVKYWTNGRRIRESCRRLIFDPLDCWSSNKAWYRGDPAAFWFWCWDALQFDDILATSPACGEVMDQAVGSRARVHYAPHHADFRVLPTFCDPAGPIVYAGGERYLGDQARKLAEACRTLGKLFVMSTDRNDVWTALKGAAACVHPRFPPHDTRLNRLCKPQIKLENAAAAGMPCVATDDPCVTSVRPLTRVVPVDASEARWAAALSSAIADGPAKQRAVTLADHVATLNTIWETDFAHVPND